MSVADWANGAWVAGHSLEKWRLLNVRRRCVPFVQLSARELDGLPFFIAGEDVGVLRAELIGSDGAGDGLLNFLLRGPYVFQIDGLAGLIVAQRLGGHVDV